MKRIALIVCLLFVGSHFLWGACNDSGHAGTCYVGSGQTYATITAAINAPVAGGQTILVFHGTYAENPTIPTGSLSNPITLKANVTTLTGTITLTNGSTAVTGVGTSFQTGNQVVANDWIYIKNPDMSVTGDGGGLLSAQVASVADDTHLTLSVTWWGPTLSGQTAYNAPNIQGVTMNSFTTLDGFSVGNWGSPNAARCVTLVAGTPTNITISNNRMTACGSIRTSASTGKASYVYVHNNTISYLCSTPTAPNTCQAGFANGDHWVVDHNEFSHLSDAWTLHASYSSFSYNYIHDFLPSECTYNGPGGNCHFDFGQTEPSWDVKHILVEGNYGGNNQGGYDPNQQAGEGHAFLVQGDACPAPVPITDPYPCSYYIARFNSFVHVAGGIMLNNKAANSMGFSHVKSYNNTWVDFDVVGSYSGHNYNNFANGQGAAYTNYAGYASDLNNITYLYYTGGATTYNPYIFDSTDLATADYGYNLAWVTADGTTTNTAPTIYGHTYQAAPTFLSDTIGGNPAHNVFNSPKFVSYTPGSTDYFANNFSLQSNSPAKATGRYLTTITGGCGTSTITVADSGFFFDGWGLTSYGKTADGIRIGTTNTYQIAGTISDSANTIPLDHTATCSNGDPVYLYTNSAGTAVLTGTTLDMGAFPYQAPVTPSLITLTASGTGSSTSNGYTADTTGVVATYNGSSLSCTPANCQESVANSSSFTISATAAAGSSVALGCSAPNGSCSCSVTTCTGNVGTGDVTITASFSIVPVCTFSLSQNSVNVGGAINYTVSCSNTTNWSIFDPVGTTIVTGTGTSGSGSLPYTTPGAYSAQGVGIGGPSNIPTAPLNVNSPVGGPTAR